ncbi:MAG TPA: M15 family metallopeptidase [Candidatus Paceibacterota bacterium]|nr:M15 family metallopeptidase [Candidatus Paceibacterota bacterium]
MSDSTSHVMPLTLAAGALCVLSLALAAYGQVRIISLSSELAENASTTAQMNADLQQKVVSLSDMLYSAQQNLVAVQDRLGGFEDSVGDISNTVGDLEKLSNTDPQLLQKYSKVYFLNENYVPKSLKTLPQQDVYSDTKTEQMLTQVVPHLEDMLDDAKDDDIDLFVVSAYRSFARQGELKSAYKVTYGAGANAFSAEQGYSEHQLGTAVDLTTTGLNGGLDGFDKTPAYQWLLKNAYKYGFILSYPQGNGYYVFEPWHWRFVGEKLAKDLHREDKNFYEMEQRDIDQYLINFFDNN